MVFEISLPRVFPRACPPSQSCAATLRCPPPPTSSSAKSGARALRSTGSRTNGLFSNDWAGFDPCTDLAQDPVCGRASRGLHRGAVSWGCCAEAESNSSTPPFTHRSPTRLNQHSGRSLNRLTGPIAKPFARHSKTIKNGMISNCGT